MWNIYKYIYIFLTLANHQQFLDFSLVTIDGIESKLHGLGPLNWVGRMMVVGKVKKMTSQLVVKKTRQEMMKVVGQESVVDMLYIHVLQRGLSRKWWYCDYKWLYTLWVCFLKIYIIQWLLFLKSLYAIVFSFTFCSILGFVLYEILKSKCLFELSFGKLLTKKKLKPILSRQGGGLRYFFLQEFV